MRRRLPDRLDSGGRDSIRKAYQELRLNRLLPLCRPQALGLAVCLCLTANPSLAAEPKLRVVSSAGGGATTERVLPLNALNYTPGTATLSAQTRSGNVTCGTAGSATGMSVTIDGSSYPIITAGGSLPNGLTAPIDYAVASGNVSLALNGLLSSDCVTTNVFGSGQGTGGDPDVYDILFPGQVTRTIAEAVYFDVNARRFDVRVSDPILCTSYASTGLTVALADPNDVFFVLGASELLPGVTGTSFDPATLTFSPSVTQVGGGPAVQCSTPGAVVLPTPGGDGGSTIFVGDFEDGSSMSRPDLVVTLEDMAGLPLSAINAIPGQSFGFRVRIENIGEASAQDVRLREFLPLPAGIRPTAMAQGGVNDTCERLGGSTSSCGLDGLSFPIREDGLTVDVGETLLLTLSRRFADGVVPGPAADLGYAAFVSGSASAAADANITDNGRWTTATPISNQPPQISTITMAAFDEDGSGTATFTVTDAEGDTVGTPTATSNNQTVLPNGNITITPLGGNSYELSVEPAADKNGPVTVTVSATDGNSAPVVQPVVVTINAVNDAPDFTLSATEIVVPACNPCSPVTESGFVDNIVPGPATATDESAQNVSMVLLDNKLRYIDCGNIAGVLTENPAVGATAPYALIIRPFPGLAVSTTLNCSIEVVDDGVPAENRVRAFTIVYPPPGP